MDRIFDRLSSLIRSYLDATPGESQESYGQTSNRSTADPDLAEAWDELNDYLKTGHEDDEASRRRSEARERERASQRAGSRASAGGRLDQLDELRQDFKNLEVAFGSPLDVVKKSYKKLLMMYHPDKHSNDPEKFKSATEITKKLNYSFQRIEKYYETGKV